MQYLFGKADVVFQESHLNAHATDIIVITVMVWFASSVQDQNCHFIVDG